MAQLKYASSFFIHNPAIVVKAAREAWAIAYSSKSCYRSKKNNRLYSKQGHYKRQAHALLSALGVSDQYQRDRIIIGKADVVADEDGWLCYIDHEISAEVMQRLVNE